MKPTCDSAIAFEQVRNIYFFRVALEIKETENTTGEELWHMEAGDQNTLSWGKARRVKASLSAGSLHPLRQACEQ